MHSHNSPFGIANSPTPAPAPAPIFKALAAAGLIAPFLSHGAIITVNTTAETSAPGQCSLRDAAQAVRFAGATVNGCAVADASNEIRFASNVVGTITYSGVHNVFNLAGVEFNTAGDLAITGPGASVLGISCDANSVSAGAMLIVPNLASNVTISGLSFNNCLSAGSFSVASAGGLTLIEILPNSATTTSLSDLVISGNAGLVGGLSVSSSGATTLRRLSITGNNGFTVGGVVVQGSAASADINVQSSTIANNTASFVSGGGLVTNGDVSVNNTTVSGNVGGQNALLIQAQAVGISHSTIVRNTVDPLANSTSYTALAFGFGGGGAAGESKSARADGKALTVPSGLNNSIVCGNSQFDVGAFSNVIANYNLLGSISPPGAIGGTGNVTGCGTALLNNWLGPLANNGGPTQTHALLNVVGNPAINGGDPGYTGSPNDQTGVNVRTSGGRTDMGAFEFVTAAANAQNVPVPTTGAAGLGALALALAALGARRRQKK
jgi:hypothetical protein